MRKSGAYMINNIDEILDEELNKLKISSTEREILIEEFEWKWEYFLSYTPNPTKNKARDFVKEYLKENACEDKPTHMTQVKKEKGQMDCILYALKVEKKHMSVATKSVPATKPYIEG